MSDKLANEQSNINVVNWSRKNYLVVISGVNVNGMSYMHCPDPSMGMELNGITNYDMKNFRFKCSMILPEFERFALELSGNSATSTFSDMMVKILNNNYFRYYDDGELTIIKMRDSGEKIVINNTNGLVYALDEVEGFLYKGAISNSNSFCYHSYLTTQMIGGLANSIYSVGKTTTFVGNNKVNIGVGREDLDNIYGALGEVALTSAVTATVAVAPLVIISGGIATPVAATIVGLSVTGCVFMALANDVDTQGINQKTILPTAGDIFTTIGSSLLS